MITILEKDHQKALDFLQELLYDWYDPLPPTDLTGIGEEMYRLLKTDFGMELPDVSADVLASMNCSVIDSLQEGMCGEWVWVCCYCGIRFKGSNFYGRV
tara:strand:- start:640 stop:936 length:297 start_codon:yes stop_codon:yes gene_type:complete